MNRKFIYKGSLKDISIPEIFGTIHYHQVPGILQISQDTLVKKIYFNNGEVVFGYSNQPQDRLGDILLKEGVITTEQHRESVAILEKSGGKKKHGQILVELGYLTPKRLFVEVKRQVEIIVASLFDMQDGKVQFSCGPFDHADILLLNLKSLALIYAGIKRTFTGEGIKVHLKTVKRVLVRTPRFQDLEAAGIVTPYEGKIAELVDGESSVEKICLHSPINTMETCKFLSFLIVSRLVE